jgi:RNA-directed DNA polymerase
MGPEAKAPGKARGYADGAPEEQKVDASRTSQSSVSNQATPGMYVWEDLPWTKVERKVFKLQRRIYRASQRADTKTVHALQRLLLRSWYAKVLAVRRVTQDNQGKNTPGVDGIASLKPPERLELAHNLNVEASPQPIRRVWIPKPGTDEQRPLGIPTVADRGRQALVKLALEPEWEAKFEPNSYGFRPGRSCHDAIEAIFTSISKLPKYVLDADIAKCFDRISHATLLSKLNTFPQLHRLIKGWLEAGVLEGDQLFPTTEGTPQGGVLSPLLANVALHGMEQFLVDGFFTKKTVQGKRQNWTPTVIRYADDLVVCHPDLEIIQQCQHRLQQWLQPLGLELKPSKTRIRHTLKPMEGETGFDFLGFTIRQFPVGKYHTGTNSQGHPLGFKTLIQPSAKKVQLPTQRLGEIVRHHEGAPQEGLIAVLNPIIRGWCNYYRTAVSKKTYADCDHVLYQQLRRWGNRRHPHKGRKWVARKYWRLPKWSFGPEKGLQLAQHTATRIVRHIKIQGDRSPFDGEWGYWTGRMGRYPGMSPWKATVLRRQGGKCAHCGLYFRPGDLVEIHHEDKDHGNNRRRNLVALHLHCHDGVHRAAKVNPQESVHDKDCSSEEPYERESLKYGSADQPGRRLPG